jgi:hypothetical protein
MVNCSQWTTMFGHDHVPMNWRACWELAVEGWPWLNDRRLFALRVWVATIYFAGTVVPLRVWRCSLARPLRIVLVGLTGLAAYAFLMIWSVVIALPVTALICAVVVVLSLVAIPVVALLTVLGAPVGFLGWLLGGR